MKPTKIRIATLASVLALAVPASAQLFSDNFEGTLGNWSFNPTTPGLTITTDQNHTPGGASSAVSSTSSSGMYHGLGELDGYVKLTYWLYDSTGTRDFVDLRAHSGGSAFNPAGISQLFAIGKYHVGFGTPTGIFTGQTVDTTKYQARILTGPDSGWFNLPNSVRTADTWVKFDLERLGDGTVNFYVNDALSISVATATYFSIDNVFAGSVRAGTTATVGYFDDLTIAVPEPSTLALGVLGGLAWLARQAKRRMS